MIHLSKFKVSMIVMVCLFGVLYTLPNIVSENTRLWMVANLPAGFPKQTVNLGLDLRGGAHLVYEINIEKVFAERSEMLVQDMRTRLREKEIGFKSIHANARGLQIVLNKADDADAVKTLIRENDNRLLIETAADGVSINVSMAEANVKEVEGQVISQVIEVVRRRVDEMGTTEPIIQRQGENRVIIQAPGANSEELRRIIGRTAKLGFHLLGSQDRKTAADMTLSFTGKPDQKINVKRRSVISGDMLETAHTSFGQNGDAVVAFRFNGAGARKFCDVTKENTGQPFAIVLDDEVISAPRINEPICGGSGQISGNFSTQEASDLALLLRSGALPAEMQVVEERTVGPSLGADSVAAGKMASLFALVLVITFLILSYTFFGVLATIALLSNVTLIMAVLSCIQATLTLPGIAGIVLTFGMAVDANVLIFERIREEFMSGRSVVASIEAGYSKAMATIFDANLTTLIAALILFFVGSGPVKGFAVTLGVGVMTSYFSAVMITRLLVLIWLRRTKPKALTF